MARTHRERDDWEDRFFDVQDKRLGRIEDKVDDVTVVAHKALDHAKEASRQATLTNSQVAHTKQDIADNLAEAHKVSEKALDRADRAHVRLKNLEAVVIPNKSIEAEDVKNVVIPKVVWKLIAKIVAIVSAMVGIIGVLVYAANK